MCCATVAKLSSSAAGLTLSVNVSHGIQGIQGMG
jgi:hypothetical protein